VSQGNSKSFVLDLGREDFVLTAAGKDYKLRYDFAAFRIYENQTGVNPFTPGFSVNKNNLDVFLWSGLRAREPGLALELVQGWITPANAPELLDYVGEAYFAAFPPQEGDGSDEAHPPSA